MVLDADIHYMRSALAMARRGLGRTAPNPSVGCVIVKDGIVVARARTADMGRPHAETAALEQAGINAQGATLYVTLEPCTHEGHTPPCTKAIMDAKISKVVIGALDCDPRVYGQSIDILKEKGIDVVYGVLEDECLDLNSGFFSCIQNNLPFVTLKVACSLDGKIALASGESQWITGDHARRHSHALRSRHDAIMVGMGTVVKDDPMLSARIDGVEHSGIRIVLDKRLEMPMDSILVRTAYAKRLWLIHGSDHEQDKGAIIATGAHLHQVDDPNNLKSVLNLLASQGITRLMVEGGASLHTSFLQEGLFDELVLYRAPTLLGQDAMNVSGGLHIETLADRYDLTHVESRKLGSDMLEIYKNEKGCAV